MKFSTTLKSMAIAATLILCATEASAQLPVRTRSLQLLGATSGTLTQQAAATTTAYTVTWPTAAFSGAGVTQAFMRGTLNAGNVDLDWRTLSTGNDLIEGDGTTGQIAYFDGTNSITSSPNLLIDATTATVTIGAAAEGGELVLNATGTGNPDVTFSSNAATTAVTYNFPSYGTAPSVNVVGTTDIPAANEIPVAQADGTITWEANPITGIQRGVADPTDAVYTFGITVTGTPDANDVVVVTSYDTGGVGNILAVTAYAANTITVTASGPFTASERITYIWIPIP